jgi:hypothetical protein
MAVLLNNMDPVQRTNYIFSTFKRLCGTCLHDVPGSHDCWGCRIVGDSATNYKRKIVKDCNTCETLDCNSCKGGR